MDCPHCGQSTPVSAGSCPRCGAVLIPNTIAMGVVPIDTTGLPPGATFGAMTGVGTVAAPGATIEVAVTVETAGIAGSKADGPLKVGQAFGQRYHIIKLLGAGGMGAVYQAWDAELGVAVALKVIRHAHGGELSQAEERLKQELLLARQVTHKHVVRIHDIGEIDGIKYITMPYVQGNDLATELRRSGKLPVARALRFARQIAAGLQAAHDAGVIHRDLKPPNIMISGAGDDPQALIMDFGISASTDQAASGAVIGTLEYMAPEQATGGAFDGRADIYAVGLILYEMLTGPRLVADATPQARVDAMKQRFEEGLVPLRALDRSIPEPIERFVMRCVERDPARRFQTAAELVDALARLDDRGELIPIAARLTKPMIAAAAAIVLLLLGGTYLGTRRLVTPPKAHDPVSVLIADFENRSGDPIFDGVLEQSLGIALERASYINVFKAGDRHALAARVTNGKSSRLTEEVGQLIARREGIKVLVAGGIEKQPRGYRLELRALDPANVTKPITTVRQTLTDKSQVLNDITGVADRIREALGESKTEMAKLAAAETVTAASLDAMSAYARAQELQTAGKYQEALPEYQRAVELDPAFGRAYAGIAGVYANYFKQRDKAEASFQMALKHLDRMTEREKYRTLGKYYLDVAGNYEKAIETYETLVSRYPVDDNGHGGLALAYVLSGDLPRALPHVRSTLEIYPHYSLQRYNYAMYSMYAGDFATAIEEASVVQKENPTLEYAWLPVALSRLAQGDQAGARDAYARLAAMSAFGSSLSQLGLADLDMYLGRQRDAVRALREGLAADIARKDSYASAQKYLALAEAYLSVGDRTRAIDASDQAVKLTDREGILYPAARVLLQAGKHDEAAQVADALEKKLQRHTTAYAGLIRGESALQRGRLAEAIEAIINAQKRRDSWFSRYLLGKAYLTAGGSHAAESLAELDRCVKRRGEASDAFIDDMPTLRYLPPAYYWLGRAQEGVGSTAEANKSYKEFLALRVDADSPDPLAVDARRRINAR